MIGGWKPSLRGKRTVTTEKKTCNFLFLAINPEAISNHFAADSQSSNLKFVIKDILSGQGNNCILPGELEARARALADKVKALLLTKEELKYLNDIAVKNKIQKHEEVFLKSI
jgi:L-2-hydroxycarboxylate dehydrogenase (NAD+)